MKRLVVFFSLVLFTLTSCRENKSETMGTAATDKLAFESGFVVPMIENF